MFKKQTVFNSILLAAMVLSLVSAPVLAARPPAPSLQISWYDADWPYRKGITIDHTQVEADLTSFPVLVRLGADADLASRAQNSGDDILFTDASDNKLNHEIEYFNGSTGELVAWVNVPGVSSATDTVLRMYYGNPAAPSQANPEAVWDADTVMVQHLNETSGTHFDSTQYSNDGTPQNGLVQDATGEIDGADDFAGDDDFIDAGTQASMDVFGPNQDFGIFMWVKRDNTSDVQGFFSSGSSGNFGIYFGSAYNNEDDLRFMSTGNTVQIESTGGVIGDNDWHYVGVVADRDGNLELWVDGTPAHSESIAAHAGEDWNRLDDTYKIGTDRSENNPLDGMMDEVRVSRVARSAGWIRTAYNNMADPSQFADVGPQEQIGVPAISNENPADGSEQVSVSLTELSFHIEDPEGDPMDFDVTTSPDIGSRSETDVSAGTYTVNISGLDYGQAYTWYVDVTDGTHTAHEELSFSTEFDIPIISNEEPEDGAANVGLNPTLRADVLDQQGDSVEWEIEVELDGSWELVNGGTLHAGSGTVSATTGGVDEYGTLYRWRVRARDAGSGTWVEETFGFTTIENEIRFAAFADTHIGGMIETGWGMAEHLDDLGQDIMNSTLPCDFTVHLGDIIMHSTAYVEGEQLPSRYDQYLNNFKAFLLQHINMPFMAVSGNHDLNDYYGENHSGYPQNGDDPFNLVRTIIDATEMNSYPYAFMKNDILFIALPETDYHMFTKPITYEYVEYMTRRYPDNTTIIFSHQAIEDTTIHDGSGSSTYRGQQDRAWWAELFRNNPQIKMWIHGHQHMLDWYQSDHSSGSAYPVEDFGHEMVFSMPYSQADWGNYFEEDRTVIYSISQEGISTQAWENNGAGGHWVSGYDHQWDIQTTYDETAQDWYSFPVFVQDGEIQLTDMKALSPNMVLELIGTQPMELFYDPTMATQGTTWGGENLLGFGNDYYSEATPTLPGMTVHGPADLDFPPKYPGSAFQGGGGAYHEDGRTGQPYHFFPVGTSHAAIPGASYTVTITARSLSGAGQINVDLSVSDWGTRSQYSTLAGSTQPVISHAFGTAYETVTGTYTVPNDDNAWFLQGYLDFPDSTDYDVSLFSIKRSQDTATTDDFGLSLNGNWYTHTGTLQQYARSEFVLDPTTLTDENGVIEISSSIDGNHFGMARIIYNAPMLMGRNARFNVNSVDGNDYSITLQDDLSYYSDTFKMFPLSKKYGSFAVMSDDGSAARHVSANGNEWIECNTPTENTKVTLEIEYGADMPVISDESPANFATDIDPNPTLQAHILDLQGDQVDWEIRTNASGTWQAIGSGTLAHGAGTVTATPTHMSEYNTTYFWSVSAMDADGSGEAVEETYRFTTGLDNYPPAVSNPSPADGAIDVPPNPTLSVDVSDPDGDLMDITFRTDASGTWEDIATYTAVGDGTYTAIPTTMGGYVTSYNWSVDVDDGGDPVGVTYHFTTRSAPGAWWNTAWLYRKQITINHDRVDGELAHFPVLIDITDPDLAMFAQGDGDDIVFTDHYGTRLSHEIELYDAATGHLIAWVNVPSLSSAEDTILYMYFGNGEADNQQDVGGTWDGNFVMVQHLAEPSGTHVDSTAFHNDGTTVVVTDQDAAGMIDGADEFDGTDDYVRVPNAASLQFGEGSLTAEVWIYPTSVPDTGGARIVNNRGTGGGGQYAGWQLKIANAAGRWELKDTSIDDAAGNYQTYEGTTTYGYDQWYHVAMVYDADNGLILYVDGAVDGTLAVGAYGSITNNLPTAIGGSIADRGVEGAANRQFFDGIIDEVRLSDAARSAEWISTSYNNQSDPDAFHSVGDLELVSEPPQASNPDPADGATNVSISLSQLSFDLHDNDGDLMDYTVTTDPDVGSAIGTGVVDGPYAVGVAGLAYDTTYTWTISVTDGFDATEQSYSFTTERAPAAWWDSTWAYRKKITIDHTQVAEDLVNFPVVIEIADGSLAGFVQDDADDIAFTDYDGTQLDHEIESYESVTGALVAWVSVPALSSVEDTILYMYYGNSEASNQENVEAVWDSDYVLVQHLDETTGDHYDSTSYHNDGTPYNLASQDAVGKIDGADEFHDQSDLIDVGTDASLDVYGPNQDFGIFLWAQRDDYSNVHGFFSSGSSAANGAYFGTAWENYDDLRFLSPDNTVDVETTSGVVGDTNWHYVGMTADRDGNLDFWVDGVSVDSFSIAAYTGQDWNRLDDTYKIGTDRSENGSMDGRVDEVRVSKIVRSPGWILTSYNNQNDPGAFCSVSQEPAETYAAPTITLVSPVDGSVEEAPIAFSFTPHCGSPGRCTRAELWLNADEWRLVDVSDTPIVDGAANSIEFALTGYSLPQTLDWNVRVIQSDNQSAWGVEREIMVLPAWYDSGWLYRRMIIIDHTKVDGDLVDFPVLIRLTDGDLAAKAQSDGDDILFADPAGAKLDHEIEVYDGLAGDLITWVRVPFLSSTQDTVLYMYYGNASADNQENVPGVWDGNFVMVQHLAEPSGTHVDSTAFHNDGTTVVVTDQDAAGMIDGADEFDGTDDHVRVPNDASLQFGEGSLTAEAWIYPTSVPDSGGARIVNNRGTGRGGQYAGWQLKIADAAGQWEFRDTSIDDDAGNYQAYNGTTSYGYDQWYHVAMVYDADNGLILYVDGAVDGTLAVGPYGSITNNLPTAIGGSIADGGVEGAAYRQFFDGIIDEVRLSDAARSAEWISTSYENQTDPASFVILPEADLALEKSAGDERPNVGDDVTFTIALTNGGPDPATGVRVQDILPAGLAYASDDSDGDYNPATGVWDVGYVASGEVATLAVTATVTAPGTFTNTAQVSAADQLDPDSTPDNDVHTEDDQDSATLITQQADLALEKSAGDDRPNVGDDVTFTIALTNSGPDLATGVTVEDALPGGLAYASDDSDGDYDPGTGVWDVGSVASGDTATLAVTVTITAPGTFTNTAQVSTADQFDPDSTPDNDVHTEDDQDSATLITQQADLALEKSVDDDRPNVGDDIAFTIALTNGGPDLATGVTVEDALPAGLAYASDDSDGDYDPGSGVWDVGSMASGDTATLAITVTVTAPGTFTNTAQVSAADQFDPDSTPDNDVHTEDDQDSASLMTEHSAAVAITVTPAEETVTEGESVTYHATAEDAYDSAWDVTAETTFDIEAGAGGTWAGNVYTSAVAGDWTVTGEYKDLQDTGTLHVDASAPTTITIYLPLIANRRTPPAPDLVVEHIAVTPNSAQVVIKNQGDAPVTDSFWVDLYIDPHPIPTGVNQIWNDFCTKGIVWGVVSPALPLAPGGMITLTLHDAYYWSDYSKLPGSLPPGTPIYVQVDSASTDTTYGAVLENHEIAGAPYNNIAGPVGSTLTAMGMGTAEAEPPATSIRPPASSRYLPVRP